LNKSEIFIAYIMIRKEGTILVPLVENRSLLSWEAFIAGFRTDVNQGDVKHDVG